MAAMVFGRRRRGRAVRDVDEGPTEALSVRRVVFAAKRILIPGDFYDAPLAWGEIDREGRVDGRLLAIDERSRPG
jgi:hypothetical protein